jgi:ribonuclease BN (tRNA processing enzyme)
MWIGQNHLRYSSSTDNHDLGLADVMSNDFYRLNRANSADTINIYGPPQTKELVDAAFQYIAIPFRVFAAEPIGLIPIAAHEVPQEGMVFQDDKVRVIAAENSHYALMPADLRKRMKSYSYRIETPHGVIVFTGDTGPSDAVIRLARHADVLVSEVEDLGAAEKGVSDLAQQNHWSPERSSALKEHMRQDHLDLRDVGEMATKAEVGSVILYPITILPIHQALSAA